MTSDEPRSKPHPAAEAGRDPVDAPPIDQTTPRPELKVPRQFRLSAAEDELMLRLKQRRGDPNLIDTERWLLSLVPGLLSGEFGIDPTHDPADHEDPGQIEGAWQAVADALDAATTAWRSVSPESTGPITELRADVQWNVAYWRARARGLDSIEAGRETRRAIGQPSNRHITYDPAHDDE